MKVSRLPRKMALTLPRVKKTSAGAPRQVMDYPDFCLDSGCHLWSLGFFLQRRVGLTRTHWAWRVLTFFSPN